MTHYIFAPSALAGYGEHEFTTLHEAFSADEIKQIIEFGDSLPQTSAVVGGNELIPDIRRSTVSWIEHTSETQWIFDRLAYVVRSLNSQYYGFDLHGFCEAIQFTTYNEEVEGGYNWHLDSGVNSPSPRKMSLVVQLSDPADYEGGDLEILTAVNPTQVNKGLGLAAMFPSFRLHRVTPVTKGIRKSLVIWITGPKFI